MKKTVFIIIIFILLEIIMTYPLVFKVTDHVPGFFSTDESLSIPWGGWFNKFATKNHLSLMKTDFISYPFGVELYRTIGFIWFGINYLLAVLTTPILTYNLQVLINFFLAALFTYFFVYFVSGNTFSAILSGIAFAFCPYMFVRTWQHLGDTYIWVIPLALFGLVLLSQKVSRKHIFIFALGMIFMSIGFNFLYAGLTLALFMACLFIRDLRRRKLFSPENKKLVIAILFSFLIFVIVMSPQIYTVTKGIIASKGSSPSVFNVYHRPFEDLFAQSVRPLSYILPATVHPVFGGFTEQFVGTELYGMSFTEHTLYLGWIPLILAFIAFRRRKKSANHSDRFYIGFFILLAVFAWLFSQPPWWKIGNVKIYMPPFFIYQILPVFRAYCRFGIVVMFAVAVLAGFGLKFLLESRKTLKSKIGLSVLCCGLILFEFWNYPPFKVIDVSRVPAVYYWLKEQPRDTVIAEYPLDQDAPNEMYRLYQATHEKKMINYTVPGTYANKVAHTINKISDPSSAEALRWMGVKYVLVHRDKYLQTELIEDREELNKLSSNPGLKFVKDFPAENCPQQDIRCVKEAGPIDVYEVIAQPKEPKVEK